MCNVQKRYVTLNIDIKSKYYNKLISNKDMLQSV